MLPPVYAGRGRRTYFGGGPSLVGHRPVLGQNPLDAPSGSTTTSPAARQPTPAGFSCKAIRRLGRLGLKVMVETPDGRVARRIVHSRPSHFRSAIDRNGPPASGAASTGRWCRRGGRRAGGSGAARVGSPRGGGFAGATARHRAAGRFARGGTVSYTFRPAGGVECRWEINTAPRPGGAATVPGAGYPPPLASHLRHRPAPQPAPAIGGLACPRRTEVPMAKVPPPCPRTACWRPCRRPTSAASCGSWNPSRWTSNGSCTRPAARSTTSTSRTPGSCPLWPSWPAGGRSRSGCAAPRGP